MVRTTSHDMDGESVCEKSKSTGGKWVSEKSTGNKCQEYGSSMRGVHGNGMECTHHTLGSVHVTRVTASYCRND
jgi:hypothetical protein